MESKSKVVIDMQYFEKVIFEIKTLSVVCIDEQVKVKLKELYESLNKINDEQNKTSVEEKIANKMEEVRGRDSELNAKLYMLHQDLKKGRLSDDDALEIFERYVRHKNFDRMIY
jgi:DNA-directed RNA polymerase alpha subunit